MQKKITLKKDRVNNYYPLNKIKKAIDEVMSGEEMKKVAIKYQIKYPSLSKFVLLRKQNK